MLVKEVGLISFIWVRSHWDLLGYADSDDEDDDHDGDTPTKQNGGKINTTKAVIYSIVIWFFDSFRCFPSDSHASAKRQ